MDDAPYHNLTVKSNLKKFLYAKRLLEKEGEWEDSWWGSRG
jgi:hypothetical protein